MERDFAIRFSDEAYLSKDEIKKSMNLVNVDYIYSSIKTYRSYYARYYDFFSIERKPYVLCLTNGIINRLTSLEKKLNRIIYYPLKNKIASLNEYFIKYILKKLSVEYSLNGINEDIITSLLASKDNIPLEYNVLIRYYNALKDIELKNANDISENTILRLYGILYRDDATCFKNLDEIIRKNEETSVDENVDNHAKLCPVDKIKDNLISFLEAINNMDGFVFAKAIITIYYIRYLKPFDIFNEELAILLAKYILCKEEPDSINIPLEILFEFFDSNEDKKIMQNIEEESDLTYAIYSYIIKIDESLKFMLDAYEKSLANTIINEAYLPDEEKPQIDDNSSPSEEDSFQEKKIDEIFTPVKTKLVFKQNVSMPVLPSGLNEVDAQVVAKNLIEICPTLKKQQAEFYAYHCTIGKYYTIQQYKLYNKVAYETARTSMDNLASLGFYKKEKILNKFVYTPTIRSEED